MLAQVAHCVVEQAALGLGAFLLHVQRGQQPGEDHLNVGPQRGL